MLKAIYLVNKIQKKMFNFFIFYNFKIYKFFPNFIQSIIEIAKPNTNPAIQRSLCSGYNGEVSSGVIKNVRIE